MSPKAIDTTGPLKTREVFLDTQAYRKVEFDLGHPTMAALFSHVDANRLRLHTTDITLREIWRQILALAEGAAREVTKAREILKRWKSRAPKTLENLKIREEGLDGQKMGSELFVSFRDTLTRKRLTEHKAAARGAVRIFQAYFDRRPPFDTENSKEFPDAFVIDALEGWCEDNQTQMYVVTGDKAMLRAAAASPLLFPIDNLAHLLSIATMDHAPDVEQAVAELMGRPQFASDLESLLDDEIGNLGIIYLGDLSDGEAIEAERSGPVENLDWTTISAGDNRFGLILQFGVQLTVQVEHEDRSAGFYDREDDRYYGAEAAHAEIMEDADLRMFVEIDASGTIVRHDMLTRDVEIYDRDEY